MISRPAEYRAIVYGGVKTLAFDSGSIVWELVGLDTAASSIALILVNPHPRWLRARTMWHKKNGSRSLTVLPRMGNRGLLAGAHGSGGSDG